jgi:signal transduction histidine kinase
MVRQSLLAAMGEMTQSMAFLWREPLAVLSKYIDDISVMVDASEHDYKELERITVKCMEQVLFMSSTIEDFRFFFKPSHRKKLFEVRGTVQEIMCLIAPHLQSENITLIFSCFLEGDANPVETELLSNLSRICGAGFPECVKNCGSFGLPVCGYPAEFKLAILSIFHNSRRLLEKSGGMEKQIMLNLYDRGDSVMIDVFDNSRGMSEEDIQAVYNPYSDYAEDGMIYFNLYMALTLFETNMKGKVSFSSTLEGLNINILVPKRVSECRQSLAEEV